jgi:hypothetical protein
MSTTKRQYPDAVLFTSTGTMMSGKEAYTTVRNNRGNVGFRKDLLREDIYNFI